MRYRITIMGKDTRLQGYASGEVLGILADRLGGPEHDQLFLVVASPADADYDPFHPTKEEK